MVLLFVLLTLTSISALIQTSAGLPYVGQTETSSISQPGGIALDGVDCNDLTWNLKPECWDALDIPKWLTQWWNTNEETCREQNATFASCFQQMAGVRQQQCDTIGDGLCSYPTNITEFSPQEAYVLYSIFGIWHWYFSLYQAIGNANLGAQGPVGKIVDAINPLQPPALLGSVVGNTLETALRQAPGVLKQMNPTGTINAQFAQVNEIYDGLSKIQQYYQANLTTALNLVQSSFSTFLGFSAQGGFIAPQSSLQAQSEVLLASLQTFIVSSCLSQSNIMITLARDTNPHELTINGTLTKSDLVSCDYYEDHGICSTWWYDPSTNRAYGLSSVEEPQKNFYDLLKQIFSNEWTTPAELFGGALECAEYVKATGNSNQPTLDVVTMQPRCLSNVQVCVYDQGCDVDDSRCEFTGEYGAADGMCKPTGTFMEGCENSNFWTYSSGLSMRVPASYLGPLVKTKERIEVCND
ncbi:MAG: hypothetical protein Q9178_005701 [Gyalolechia marmorata]